VHGTSSVALAKAGSIFDDSDWKRLAERQIQWSVGHNTHNRSLYTGIGYRQPVAMQRKRIKESHAKLSKPAKDSLGEGRLFTTKSREP